MAKLGTEANPLRVGVRNKRRADEILAFCNRQGWKVTIRIDATRPEDLRDLQKMSRKQARATAPDAPVSTPRKRGKNDYCPCGSGRKYKNCCWEKDHGVERNS